MSSAERAADLRAQADALDALASLEAELTAAKAAYTANPNPETLAAKRAAMDNIREARSLTRTEGVSVGGDAYVDKEV
ncbi:hypothetical protein E1286_05110 [Nonomuraea terrae]|uniref:Uncharacterized protein n=1 Tax=Nonomuraea terrae TaxID=2530383 RepID=A0A4R4ZDX6_9ACTN|nr:hypothetical protein [Nonomuraea terrae]TDD54572.1 hypothetical protein E1286_05110 [Nonomuraea terrae]